MKSSRTFTNNTQISQFTDEYWMGIALAEAKQAFDENEIPVGAVLIKNNEIVLRSHNLTRQTDNPLSHAEMLILNEIQKTDKYLYDYTLFVTLEPCLMCSGAIILSKLGRLVYGAKDPKTGVVGSVYNVMTEKSFNHHPAITSGVLENECGQVLKRFFKAKRS